MTRLLLENKTVAKCELMFSFSGEYIQLRLGSIFCLLETGTLRCIVLQRIRRDRKYCSREVKRFLSQKRCRRMNPKPQKILISCDPVLRVPRWEVGSCCHASFPWEEAESQRVEPALLGSNPPVLPQAQSSKPLGCHS